MSIRAPFPSGPSLNILMIMISVLRICSYAILNSRISSTVDILTLDLGSGSLHRLLAIIPS